MSLVFAVDAKNDLYIGPDGSMAQAEGLAAVMQDCAQAAKSQLGEMIYATEDGVPNFATLWSGTPNVPQFRAYLRRTLLGRDNVLDVPKLTTTLSGGVLSYSATIRTTFGTGAISG